MIPLDRRYRREARRDASTHVFAIGQAVFLKDGHARPVLDTEIYHVTATLPARGNSLQYRIRNDEERHERVATQESLQAVQVSAPGQGGTVADATTGQEAGGGLRASRAHAADAAEGEPGKTGAPFGEANG